MAERIKTKTAADIVSNMSDESLQYRPIRRINTAPSTPIVTSPVINAIYASLGQTMTVTGDAGLAVATRDPNGNVIGSGIIGSDGTVTYPLNVEGLVDGSEVFTSGLNTNIVASNLIIEAPYDFKYWRNGQWNYVLTGSVITSEHTGQGLRYATKLVVKDTVTEIGNNAFREWYELVDITLPNTITKIGNTAFFGCAQFMDATQPVEIIIPDSVLEIGTSVFGYAHYMSKLVIGSSVQTIGAYSFANNRRLNTVVMKPPVVPVVGLNVFDKDSAVSFVTGEKAVYIPSLLDADYVTFANNEFVYPEGFALRELSELP